VALNRSALTTCCTAAAHFNPVVLSVLQMVTFETLVDKYGEVLEEEVGMVAFLMK
jgi:hypothetical protein